VAFVVAIEPILCCRLVLNTRSTVHANFRVTDLTTTVTTSFDTELKAYRGKPARKLDSLGLPQITGTFTANPIIKFPLWYGTNSAWCLELEVDHTDHKDGGVRTGIEDLKEHLD